MKSVMKHQFSEIPRADIERSSFDRSHGLKTTFDADYLVPIWVDEALPGDTINLNMTGFCRMLTPIYPVMDNIFIETFFFAVPNRLLWTNWVKMNGEQDTPGDSTDFTMPVIGDVTPTVGDIFDYMGLPVGVNCSNVRADFFRAYNRIYNEWFRDSNLMADLNEYVGNGPDNITYYSLKKRAKKHDYFTSCLPWPQKGDSPLVPMEGLVPVKGIGNSTLSPAGPSSYPIYETDSPGRNIVYKISTGAPNTVETDSSGYPLIYADLDAATIAGININDLRYVIQVQRLLERDARGGTRYTEILKSHFGVTSPDARLQRPEYLGGGQSAINITPVPQTSSTDVTSPQGNLAGFGTAGLRNHGFVRSFTEHCVLIGLVNVRADITYQQGLDRMFSRSTRFDFYWPALAHLGEQAVLYQEIYKDGSVTDTDIFGYQERYAEYRYKPSRITGKFRSAAAGSLEAWHLSEEFSTTPTLGETFITSNTPMARVLAVADEPHFMLDCYFEQYHARPMPVFGVPGMMDHF